MERVFLDTDVCLDLLTERATFYRAAAQLFSIADRKELSIGVSSLSFSNIHYILRQEYSATESRRILSRFKSLVEVLSVDEKIVELALQSTFKDFEDALQYYTAIGNSMPLIVTRNLRDYKQSAIPVLTPESYLKSFS
jgi:predicted nucleic acid-binding protein